MEKVTIDLQSMINKRTWLYDILASYTNLDMNNSGHGLHRLKSFQRINRKHKLVFTNLQKFSMEINDALKEYKQLTEEKLCYSSQDLQNLTELKNNVHVLRLENRKLRNDKIALQDSCEEVKKLIKEVCEMICAEQHQEQEGMDERVKDLLKHHKLETQQMDMEEKLQHHFKISERRSESLQSELEHSTDHVESLLKTDMLQQKH
ncbi:Disks large-like 5 [Sigmodon hispidus]